MLPSLAHCPFVRQLRPKLAVARGYHDESFGFRKPRVFTLPDCELTLVLVHAPFNGLPLLIDCAAHRTIVLSQMTADWTS
jgi:hypothetical protein